MRRLILILMMVSMPSWVMGSPARQADLPELVELSSDILVGVVSQSESYWDGRRIMTRHVLETTDVWRGSERSSGPIYFVTLGGRVGEIAQRVSGAPVFRRGEEVVLFLARSHQDELHPVGLSQGVFRVENAAQVSMKSIRRELKAFEFINPAVAPFPTRLKALKAAVLEVVQ
ncbi:MAG: hypothetical protein HOI23_23130 [Deltaproteobacteria bacterium]|jgi:hypothetical protein|nr:hypothetical protein [Deltaproteobacteria bacterium]MBT6434910.1 hypothetical protein [Deltaproteobacteria bacterium]MBT6490427.1 hypothetical protein [Deltaproteobacteria bacterium]